MAQVFGRSGMAKAAALSLCCLAVLLASFGQSHAYSTRGRELFSGPVVIAYNFSQLEEAMNGNASEIVIASSFIIESNLPTVTRALLVRGSYSECTKYKNDLCTLDGRYKFRHFKVGTGGRLTVRNLELSTGQNFRGASVYVTGGSYMQAERVTFSFNYATGAINGGGAIEVDQASRILVSNSTFKRNKAGFGGAIDISAGCRALIRDTLFHRNEAGVAGGAIAAFVNSTVRIVGGQCSRNSAPTAAVLYMRNAAATVCTVHAFRNAAQVVGSTYVADADAQINYCETPATQLASVNGGALVENCDLCPGSPDV